MRKGKVVLAERAFAVAKPSRGYQRTTHWDRSILVGGGGENSQTSVINKASQEKVITSAVRRAASVKIDNARLACLCGGSLQSEIPDMALLQGGDVDVPAITPPCTLSEVQAIVAKNSFALQLGTEPAGVPGLNDGYTEEGRERFGTALFIVASMMNHASAAERTTKRLFFGPFIVVIASMDLPAGAELTTMYFSDGTPEAAAAQRQWGISDGPGEG